MVQKLLHYDVLEQLGEGAKSTIYLVQDPVTRQKFAMKHVVRTDPKDLRFIEQMETEFAICKQFTHPCLRRAFDLKVVKTLLLKVAEAYMVMEYVEGKTLDLSLPDDMMQIMDIFIQCASGLRSMHQLGYAHCDIKPINILLTPTGDVKIIDFGQSCKIGTVKERIQGTPDFIAPEQVSRRPISIATDVFNLGATLYWAVTNKHIPTLYTVNKKGENSFLLDSKIETAQELNPKVPTAVSNLCTEMIATNPAKRPADMDEVIRRLELGKHILQKLINPVAESSELHDEAD